MYIENTTNQCNLKPKIYQYFPLKPVVATEPGKVNIKDISIRLVFVSDPNLVNFFLHDELFVLALHFVSVDRLLKKFKCITWILFKGFMYIPV